MEKIKKSKTVTVIKYENISKPKASSKCFVSGWGLTEVIFWNLLHTNQPFYNFFGFQKNRYPSFLQFADVQIISNKKCSRLLKNNTFDAKTMICAGDKVHLQTNSLSIFKIRVQRKKF